MYHVKHEHPFQRGYNALAEEGERADNAMMDFGILLLHAGERHECRLGKERAFLLMHGTVTFRCNGTERRADRRSLLDENPVVLHVPQGVPVQIVAMTDAEIAVMRTEHESNVCPQALRARRDEQRATGRGNHGGNLDPSRQNRL